MGWRTHGPFRTDGLTTAADKLNAAQAAGRARRAIFQGIAEHRACVRHSMMRRWRNGRWRRTRPVRYRRGMPKPRCRDDQRRNA
jgi:hypothetical protein